MLLVSINVFCFGQEKTNTSKDLEDNKATPTFDLVKETRKMTVFRIVFEEDCSISAIKVIRGNLGYKLNEDDIKAIKRIYCKSKSDTINRKPALHYINVTILEPEEPEDSIQSPE